MNISILHLSDLHRDVLEEAHNDSLLYSLERDFELFPTSTPQISIPNICVISGDLIFGSNKKGNDAYSDIKKQYGQTKNFLIELANRFFDKDRNKIIITPGNHDVCREIIKDCIEKIKRPRSRKKIKELKKQLNVSSSGIKWSWDDLCFYKISNQEKYNQKFSLFADMYEEFYEGARRYSLEPAEQWDIFDFPDLSISVGTLNSCFNNDQFRLAGEIHPGALSKLCKEMKAPKRKGWVLAATWHHNTTRQPFREDHLPSFFLQTLIESDIGLGMHGHQHSPDCFDEQHRYGPEKRKITIISASTLCAGSHSLRGGIPQSYNVIEIDRRRRQGRVHQRAMMDGDIKYPIWIPGKFLQTQTSFVDFDPVIPNEERPAHLDLLNALCEAEKALSSKKWRKVIELLVHYKDNGDARLFISTALENMNDDRKTIEVLSPPTTIPEAIVVGGSIKSLRDKQLAEEFLKNRLVAESNDTSLEYIKRSLERIV